MFHTRHFLLLILGVVSSGLLAVSVTQGDALPQALLPDPVFVSPEEAYALLPSDFFPDYKEKTAFIARVRSHLIGKIASVPKREEPPVEVAPEPFYPNTTFEPLAYEEVTESMAATSTILEEESPEPAVATSTPAVVEVSESTATTSPIVEEEEI